MATTSDEGLRALLERTHCIAVLGIKDGPKDDAFRVPAYLQQRGCRILPVSPKLTHVLGEPAVSRLADLTSTPDLINVFRAPQHLPGHTEEILALSEHPAAVWFQLGIRDDKSAARLEEAGIEVVQDRCLMVEHARLLRGAPVDA